MRHTAEHAPLLLQSFTYADRAHMLPALELEVDRCGGWLLGQRTISAAAIELHIEVQTRELIDLYAALLIAGVELTRSAHLALASGCTSERYTRLLASSHGETFGSAVVSLHLEVTFLPDPIESPGTMYRLAMRSAAA